jgi:hypothetical protein
MFCIFIKVKGEEKSSGTCYICQTPAGLEGLESVGGLAARPF